MGGNRCYVPESGGEVLVETVADPAAGDVWEFIVPNGFEYLFGSVWFELATGAAPVHNHDVRFIMQEMPGANIIHETDLHEIIQNENHRFNLYLGSSLTADVASVHDLIAGALPNIRLPSGYKIGVTVVEFDTDDQFSEIRLFATRWKVI
jgi:hypothetical protein